MGQAIVCFALLCFSCLLYNIQLSCRTWTVEWHMLWMRDVPACSSFICHAPMPALPRSPEYRCAELLVLYSEVNSRQVRDCDYHVLNLCEGREEAGDV